MLIFVPIVLKQRVLKNKQKKADGIFCVMASIFIYTTIITTPTICL